MLKTIKKCFKWLFLLGLLYLFLLFNFESNATYYYQNSSKTDKEGTPFVLLEHLWWYRDGKWSQEGDYIYQVKGIASIIHKNKISKEYYNFHQSNGLYDRFMLTISGEDIAETISDNHNNNNSQIDFAHTMTTTASLQKQDSKRQELTKGSFSLQNPPRKQSLMLVKR